MITQIARVVVYFILVLTVCTGALQANVTLPRVISDHMVLKKSPATAVWGKADSGEQVTVTLEGQKGTATADSNGKWKVTLDLSNVGQGPFNMTVEGKNKITITDVVVGEVWVASGQSNMEFTLNRSLNGETEVAQSANPMLRHFRAPKAAPWSPADDVSSGAWELASPQTSGGFTAVGYYFAKKVQAEIKQPVGLIHTSWGGSIAEAWISRDGFDSDPELKARRDSMVKELEGFPAMKKKFAEDYVELIKKTNREDKPTADLQAFIGENVSPEGWVKMTLPGTLTASGLPSNGVVWLRKELPLAPHILQKSGIRIELPANMEGFESVYWNGKLLKQQIAPGKNIDKMTPEDYPGVGYRHIFYVGKSDLKAEKNILAIRIYAPFTPAKMPQIPSVADERVKGDWMAKGEFELPDLDPSVRSSIPKFFQGLPEENKTVSLLYNGMIYPFIQYTISGVIWYQGESNDARGYQYRTVFPMLINDWRKQWGWELPFYYCQLPMFRDRIPQPAESPWAELREAQFLTLKVPNTGMAVLLDTGETGDVHPLFKNAAGERLALIALANVYGQKIPFSGPLYDSMSVEGDKIRIKFKYTDGGLVAKPLPATYVVMTVANKTAPLTRNSPNSEIEGFAICGADKKFVWADAKIDGDSVVVSSPSVKDPIAVRYGWANSPFSNLYNGAGLPASSFRTDDFPGWSINNKY